MIIEEDNFAVSFEALDFSASEISHKEFEDCTFIKCDFSHSSFKKCKFEYCHFSHCNLSLMQVLDSQFSGVVFEDCKIIGVDWTVASWTALTLRAPKFKNSVLNDSSFWGLKLESIMINGCEARDVDFREANLQEADMQDTDFTRALFRHTNLIKSNFRQATGFDIDIRLNAIKDAKFSRYEAVRLLAGLEIELVD